MRARYLSAIALQSCGPLLLLALSTAIARLAGPAEQGAFVSAKAWFDVLLAIGCFGFPQSIVIAINREGTSPRCLYTLAVKYAIALFAPLTLVSYFFAQVLEHSILLSALMALGATCVALVNIWRGVLLPLNDGGRFHLITALPSISLALVTSTFIGLRFSLSHAMPLIYSISGGVALLVGYVVFPWGAVKERAGSVPRVRALLLNGADVFVQALSFSLQSYVCFSWLQLRGGLVEAGYFGISLLILNAFGFPLQAIAPMIMNKWSKISGRSSGLAKNPAVKGGGIILLLIILLVVLSAPWFVPRIWGGAFYEAVPAVQIMSLAVVPMTLLRLCSIRLAAMGMFRFNSLAAIARCLGFVILVLIFNAGVPGIKASALFAIAWLLAETITAMISIRKISQVNKHSIATQGAL